MAACSFISFLLLHVTSYIFRAFLIISVTGIFTSRDNKTNRKSMFEGLSNSHHLVNNIKIDT